MLRYNANSRLFKYTTEEKKRYKLYKRKKVWVVAGMSLFSTATLVQQVSADEAPLTNTTAQNDVEDETSQSNAVINASEVRENASSSQTVESSVPEKEQVSESNEQTATDKPQTISEQTQDTVESDAVNKVDQPQAGTISQGEVTAKETETSNGQDAPKDQDESAKGQAETGSKQESTPAEKDAPVEVVKDDKVGEQTSDNKIQATAKEENVVDKVNNDVTETKTATSVVSSEQKQADEPAKVQGQVNGLHTKANIDFLEREKDLTPLKRTARSVATNKLETSLLATTASVEPKAADVTDGRSVGLTSLTKGDNYGTLSAPKVLEDGSKEYTYTTSRPSNGGKLGMTISYTGKKGDKFSMLITPKRPNGSGDLPPSVPWNSTPTGSPERKKVGEGELFTWTISDVPDNVTVTRTQTMPAFNFFYEPFSQASQSNKPYKNDANPYILVNGACQEIKFFINGVEAPSNTTNRVVLEKKTSVSDCFVEPYDNANKNNKRTTDENYIYIVHLDYGEGTALQGFLKLNIPVPEHFLLDQQATDKLIKDTPIRGMYLNGVLKISQPNGEGTAIVVESQKLPIFLNNDYTNARVIPFVGRYTDIQTTGSSEKPSGWYDLGDGEKHYFGKINIDTNESLDATLALKDGKSFNETVISRDDTTTVSGVIVPAAHENFNLQLVYSIDNQVATTSVTVGSPSYDSVKLPNVTIIPGSISRNLPASKEGFSAAPVLYAVGLNANGLTSFTPTYHFDFPSEITSTGIVMPLDNVSGDYADFGSYNPAQTGYTVVVTGKVTEGGEEVTHKITQRLQAGESYNPITGLIDHFGKFSNGEKLPEGVKISGYDVTPDVPYYANAIQASNNYGGLNDVLTGYVSVLGYLNTDAQDGKEYISNISVESEYKKVSAKMVIKKAVERKLNISANGLPVSGGYGNNQSVVSPNGELKISLNSDGSKSVVNDRTNLDAGGILEGKANATPTDGPGGKWPVQYSTVKEPIVYLTIPDQTDIVKYSGLSTIYKFSGKGSDNIPRPKVSRKHNTNGQSVIVLDWTGTGYEMQPDTGINFILKVRADAVNSFDTAKTLETLYAYEDKANNKTLDLYTAAQLQAMGVSTAGLRAYAPNVNADSNTSWIQVGGDFSNSNLANAQKTKIEFDDGTSADTLMVAPGNNLSYVRIIAPVEVKPVPMIKGTADVGLSSSGLNYPTQDYIDVNGKKTGLQTLQLSIVNNTSDPLKGVISVMNLPQAGVADGNNPDPTQDFTLNISGSGSLTVDPTNNYANDAHTVYYSTQLATLSADGTTLTFEDGSTWSRGQALPSQLKTVDQVTDWSTIKSLVLYVPSLSESNKIVYQFNAYSPTSEHNMSKKVTLRQVMGYENQLSLIPGTVTDTYATYATLKIVDQDGNQINGYK
ncbi:KxYKxGKxW signal peptide domain-containing protein, partial [Ligilactobacillus faecis]